MAVTTLLVALAERLGAVLPAGTSVGPIQPVADGDLPAVALSLVEVTPTMPAVGRVPAPVRVGALQVDTTVDLADPVLHVPGELPGEEVVLLSPDRRLLQLPHGGIVRADGSDLPPFGPADLFVARGATTFTVVTGTPAGNQCRPDPVTGALTFGNPLANTGTLTLRYFVGAWEVAVERYAGVLTLDAFAATPADTLALSDQLVDLLHGSPQQGSDVTGVRRLDPTAVGPVVSAGFGTARRRSLTYRFDYEREVANIRTSGGPIRSIAADVALDDDGDGIPDSPTESFSITHEGI